MMGDTVVSALWEMGFIILCMVVVAVIAMVIEWVRRKRNKYRRIAERHLTRDSYGCPYKDEL